MVFKVILFLFLNTQAQNFELEYLKFKKDPKVLEYKRINLIIDSLQKINEFSHVSTTATIAKRMIFIEDQSTFCNKYAELVPLELKNIERNICLVCKEDIIRTQIQSKYKNLFESEKYKKLVYSYLKST